MTDPDLREILRAANPVLAAEVERGQERRKQYEKAFGKAPAAPTMKVSGRVKAYRVEVFTRGRTIGCTLHARNPRHLGQAIRRKFHGEPVNYNIIDVARCSGDVDPDTWVEEVPPKRRVLPRRINTYRVTVVTRGRTLGSMIKARSERELSRMIRERFGDYDYRFTIDYVMPNIHPGYWDEDPERTERILREQR